ncbi:MAG TPA: hypothetical protein GX509_00195 [Firmicutes bacterium]|nr:hypothetical protein [Bacillota bacterium]
MSKRWTYRLRLGLLAILLLALAGVSSAQEPSTADGAYDEVFASNIVAAYPELNLSIEAILELRAGGMGWGEIAIAASLAYSSGKTLDEVVAMAESGQGWGEIAKNLGIEPAKLGHAASQVIGKARHGQIIDGGELEEATASELIAANFDLEDSELVALLQSGAKKQDILVALSAAVAAEDPNAFNRALELRQENRNWQDVFALLGIDPKGVREMKTIMQRSELRERLRDAAKEVKQQGKQDDKMTNGAGGSSDDGTKSGGDGSSSGKKNNGKGNSNMDVNTSGGQGNSGNGSGPQGNKGNGGRGKKS